MKLFQLLVAQLLAAGTYGQERSCVRSNTVYEAAPSLSNASLASCQATCQASPTCQFFTWNSLTKGCSLSNLAMGGMRDAPSLVSGTPISSATIANTTFVSAIKKTLTQDGCSRACQADPLCQSWTWFIAGLPALNCILNYEQPDVAVNISGPVILYSGLKSCVLTYPQAASSTGCSITATPGTGSITATTTRTNTPTTTTIKTTTTTTTTTATSTITTTTITTKANPATAALLLGGHDGQWPNNPVIKVEAWPCSSASIPNLPQARGNQPAAAIMSDGNLYLCGGIFGGVTGEPTDTCDIYNKTAGTWVQGGLGLKMTENRYYMPTIMVDKWAVAAGGYNSTQWLNSWEYLEISRLGGAWIKGSFQLKTPRGNHCGVAISSTSFVVVGGYNGQEILKSLEKYSMNTGFVSNLPDLPVARIYHACTLTDDSAQLIVAGGYDATITSLNSVISLDLAKLTWTTLPSMIRVRTVLTLGIFNGKLTAFGGYGGENTLEVYNGTSWAETNLAILTRVMHSMVKTTC